MDTLTAALKKAKQLIDTGLFRDAEAELRTAVAHYPNSPDAAYWLGYTLYQQSNLSAAAQCFEQVQRLAPSHAASLELLSHIAFQQHQLTKAQALAETLLAQYPEQAAYHFQLGWLHEQQQEWETALTYYRAAFELKPEQTDYLNAVILACVQLAAWEAAQNYLEQGLEKIPNHIPWLKLWGLTLSQLEQETAAQRAFECALTLAPDDAECLMNLGVLAKHRHAYDQAQSFYQQALVHTPDYPACEFRLSLLELTQGQFQSGFKHYAARKKVLPWPVPAHPALTYWDGNKSLEGKTLYLLPEQGYGDYLQFIRFSKTLVTMGARVVAVHDANLGALLQSVPWLTEVITPDAFKCRQQGLQVLIMDLGEYLTIDASQLPGTVPYVFAPPIAPTPGTIGLNWRGGSLFTGDQRRSCSLQQFLPLLQQPNRHYVSLTHQPTLADQAHWPSALTDLSPQLHTFADTAALIAPLELIITTDTALAHLAGAMGKVCWVLLAFDAAWCWGTAKNHTLWYPTIRLFRQPKAGDWSAVIDELGQALN